MKKLPVLYGLLAALNLHAQEPDYRINTGHTHQTIDGFGASDAWSMQKVGLWKAETQQQTADWLFSTETDSDGKPKGIGLSIWRFNIGAGSAGQGDDSQINAYTRTECFLHPDGSYNWEKQPGQRSFLRLAQERGVEKFIAFLNSPPVYYTQNGLATNTGRGGTFNLKDEHYQDFARFLGDVIEGMKRHEGVCLDYLCPVNEPDGHWNWIGPKQEGTPAEKREIARLVRLLGKEFARRSIDTQILISESSDYRCMMRTHMTDSRRGYQIQSFFCPDSTDTYIGNVPGVPRLMAGHSYWTNTPVETDLRNLRRELRDTLQKYNVDFWQTETCIMSNDDEIGGGGGYDFTMKTALYVARIIHHDLVYANARSWQWWRALGEDYKDGLLRMYPDANRSDRGTVKDSKLLWAFGNYSRFIRPGAVRREITVTDPQGNIIPEGDTHPRKVMCSAYRNTDGTWVIVAINYADTPASFNFQMDNGRKYRWKAYRTSDAEGENLSPVGKMKGAKLQNSLPPRSVTTFVSQ